MNTSNNFPAEDFESMRTMLTEMQDKISGVHPTRQRQFYEKLQELIFEAWLDANNPEDSFLFKNS